ncbi:unnamed protein product [Rhizophagus irregularis]|nr:unnamed protein product [Rhizophagus irregularis]
MPKHRSITVNLVDIGSIIEAFHYGPYSCYWWKTSTDKENVTFFPLRVGQKTKTCLNNRDFFVTIVIGNRNSTYLPGYLCQSDSYVSQIESDPSKAISSVYAQIFENGTRFSGPLVLGWQEEDIIHQLLRDVSFVPISIFVDSLKIFVYGIGISSQVNLFNAGPGYKSSFTHKFDGNKQAIYVSKIEDDKCVLEIYQDNQMKTKFEGEMPIDVWEKSEKKIKKYNGNQLFGLEHFSVQSLIRQHKITHAIKRYVKLGYDITFGENIEDAIKDLADRKSILGTIQGITNWSEWAWPTESDAGYIYARALPGFGLWNKFSPNKIQKITKERIFDKPDPMITQHTKPNKPWIASSVKEKDDDTETKENNELIDETIGAINLPTDTVPKLKSHELFYKGWALKENQKTRTPVKRIIPEVKELLECMFHTGTVNPRQKMSAKEMRDELLHRGHEGEINLDDIPKESTINNWITTFSRKWKQSMALRNMKEAGHT